jgi:hypothetical protein
MKYALSHVGKVCALAVASLILPTLAFADHDKEKGDKGDKDKGGKHIPVVPEANAWIVLIPFVGAVLLFSARRLSQSKA